MSYKVCSKCKKYLPAEKFGSNGRDKVTSKIKLRGACKDCEKIRDKTRYTARPPKPPKPIKVSGRPTGKQSPKVTFEIDQESGCFISDNGQSRTGRPVVIIEGKHISAYRYAYAAAHGVTVADLGDMHVHHVCRNPLCVNPAHMLLVTAEDHIKIHKAESYFESHKKAEAIRELLAVDPTLTRAELAERLDWSYDMVSILVNRHEISTNKKYIKKACVHK